MGPMSRRVRRAILSQLVEAMHGAGSWVGETHIQKSVYFMQGLLGIQMGYSFVLYKHGPYSFDLRNELSAMMGSLELDVEPRPPYGPSFVLGPRGGRDIELPFQVGDAIRFVGENLSIRHTRELERLSTALLLQTANRHMTAQEVASLMNRIKPHIPVPDARSAVEQVAELRAKMTASQEPGMP